MRMPVGSFWGSGSQRTDMEVSSTEISEIVDGLSAAQKQISPKYFYDERGSQLFDEITRLPEYYLTNTELGIMRDNIAEMVELVGKQASLIEFGSGSSLKTRILLEHLSELAAYVPVDISDEHLHASADEIREEFPHIEVLPVVADFTKQFELPTPMVMPLRNVVYFPGSTIGVDLQKDPTIIENAYNDSAGITAEFNLNMLQHLNRDYGANFDVDEFTHSANYDPDEGRVVIELISQSDQTFEIADTAFEIADGEAILTEYSHKYSLDGFATMASEAGFTVEKVWTDSERLFSVQFLTRS
jgi:uncharacterized SAM-dependent methyltransferase